MVRPVENQERLHPTEYLNKVRQIDRDHSASSRDFAYEIRELSDEEKQKRRPHQEFGEDTYESSAEEQPAAEDPKAKPEPAPRPSSPDSDQSNLDIVI